MAGNQHVIARAAVQFVAGALLARRQQFGAVLAEVLQQVFALMADELAVGRGVNAVADEDVVAVAAAGVVGGGRLQPIGRAGYRAVCGLQLRFVVF